MGKIKLRIIEKIMLSVLMGTLLVVCMVGCGNNPAGYVGSEETNEFLFQSEEDAVIESEQETTGNPLYVYVCGEVKNPGVYTLPAGSRVCDLFEIAGGFTENAATDYWNQARELTDGEMIYVPTIEEAGERDLSSGASENRNTDDGKININTATKDELMKLPGIGESKALAIIAYREEKGSFSSVDQVKKVEGIKDGVYSKIKDYIKIN